MKVTWEVEDGFMGGSRPQVVEVPDDDIRECETLDEALDVVNEYVREDFENNVSAGIRRWDEMKAEVEALRKGD
jgi:hypothetical protein